MVKHLAEGEMEERRGEIVGWLIESASKGEVSEEGWK